MSEIIERLAGIFKREDSNKIELKEVDFRKGITLADIISEQEINEGSLLSIAQTVEKQWIAKIMVQKQDWNNKEEDQSSLPYTKTEVNGVTVQIHGVSHGSNYFSEDSLYKKMVHDYVKKTHDEGDKWVVEENFDQLFDLLIYGTSLDDLEKMEKVFENKKIFYDKKLRVAAAKSFLFLRSPKIYDRLISLIQKLDSDPGLHRRLIYEFDRLSLPEPLGMELDLVIGGDGDLIKPNLIVDRTRILAETIIGRVKSFKNIKWLTGENSLHSLIGLGHTKGLVYILESMESGNKYDVRQSLAKATEKLKQNRF